MDPSMADSTGLYKEFLAERQEILCHKWIESEKAGCDIGFERALLDWTLKYRSAWCEKRKCFNFAVEPKIGVDNRQRTERE